ncbi:recombinase family protein [Alteromonas macleodii]|uniref:recombinase family protein n=1 Tax=Alteromonas macleodii TaxID=28108 RepID=UPI00066AF780|nr:recombinase family protein [Alteromonas macleodii]CAI3962334.1 Site-specific DNA recombinase [Alteromonas macleodii]VTP53556.1 Site-specific DNA recombinase [Alteromonas macleodii]
MEIGYIRVSTVEQNTARQLDGLALDKVYTDKCSGKDTDRPQLKVMLEHLREGDTVHVHDISRMARNVGNLLDLVESLRNRGVTLKFHKENMTFTPDKNDPMQELMLTMLGGIYQFERSMILERQREGIAIAKAEGKYKGRPKSIDRERVKQMLEDGISIRKIAAQLSISPSTVQAVKKEMSS